LVRLTPDVIVGAAANPALAELQRLTNTIPIVFVQISDPVESGFVAQSCPSWRQHNRLHQLRVCDGGQVAGSAQGGHTQHESNGHSLWLVASQPNGGLIVFPHPYTAANRGSIIILAARYRLPAIYPFQYFAVEGGLMSYGPDQLEEWRGAAGYIDRILRGEKAGDLPYQQPTKYELIINLRSAKALGLTVPPKLLFIADEVIE
jgi:putative ABC transport system substrate-binding protein